MTLFASNVFGAEAARYDALRPGYPIHLVREVLGAVPPGTTALDVGCGTGKLAVLLHTLGLTVTGVEPDPRMARHATVNGVDVEVAPFEAWNPAGRRFDVVSSGQAWHWLTPVHRSANAFAALRPGGLVMLVWNLGRHTPQGEHVLADVYRDVGLDQIPDTSARGQSPGDTDLFAAELTETGFRDLVYHRTTWLQQYDAATWCQLLTTESWHLGLLAKMRAALLQSVESAINDRLGGSVEITYECVALSGKRT